MCKHNGTPHPFPLSKYPPKSSNSDDHLLLHLITTHPGVHFHISAARLKVKLLQLSKNNINRETRQTVLKP